MNETHLEKRLIGYARVSTYGQTLDSQLKQLREAGCSSRNIYREKVTGARADRRELKRANRRSSARAASSPTVRLFEQRGNKAYRATDDAKAALRETTIPSRPG